jgi:hypothetical protein
MRNVCLKVDKFKMQLITQFFGNKKNITSGEQADSSDYHFGKIMLQYVFAYVALSDPDSMKFQQ